MEERQNLLRDLGLQPHVVNRAVREDDEAQGQASEVLGYLEVMGVTEVRQQVAVLLRILMTVLRRETNRERRAFQTSMICWAVRRA